MVRRVELVEVGGKKWRPYILGDGSGNPWRSILISVVLVTYVKNKVIYTLSLPPSLPPSYTLPLTNVVSLMGYRTRFVPSRSAWLFTNRDLMELYSLSTNLHREVNTCRCTWRTLFGVGCFSVKSKQRASTTRLLEGDMAELPAERKHL